MARQQTFADKVMKSQRKRSDACPQCGTEYSYVHLVTSERSNSSGSWKFRKSRARVCKCNEKEVYG